MRFSVRMIRGTVAAALCAAALVAPVHAYSSAAVAIVDNGFSPGGLTINVGDTVTWSNTGRRAHTTSSDTGVWDSRSMGSGGTFAFTFNSPGSFAYHCAFHAEMHGTITVQAIAAPTAQPTLAPVATAPPVPTRTPVPAPAVAPTAAPVVVAPPTPVGPGALAATTIDPVGGGVLSTPAQDISLMFAPGAVAGATDVSLLPVPAASSAGLPDGYRLGSTRFQLTARDGSGQQAESFSAPAALTVRPAASELADVSSDATRLSLARLNSDTGSWELLETSVNDDGTLSAAIDRPGTFGVLETNS